MKREEEPLPVRRLIIDGVTHGVRKGRDWDEVAWCDTADQPKEPGARWNDGFRLPIKEAVWSTAPITCLECINNGGPDG